MDAEQINTQAKPCQGSLTELRATMLNTMVTCLSQEHRRLEDSLLKLALAATRLTNDRDSLTVRQQAIDSWEEIRPDLWSHLQIEDELVFSWGAEHHAISPMLLDALKIERQELRGLLSALPESASHKRSETETFADPARLAQTLSALAQTLDRHVERYESEVLPAILRALFRS
jgi:hemerythrin-like domain-containing protein